MSHIHAVTKVMHVTPPSNLSCCCCCSVYSLEVTSFTISVNDKLATVHCRETHNGSSPSVRSVVTSSQRVSAVGLNVLYSDGCYVAAKATYIRLLHGKIGILAGFFGPSSVHRGRTHVVLG